MSEIDSIVKIGDSYAREVFAAVDKIYEYKSNLINIFFEIKNIKECLDTIRIYCEKSKPRLDDLNYIIQPIIKCVKEIYSHDPVKQYSIFYESEKLNNGIIAIIKHDTYSDEYKLIEIQKLMIKHLI